MDYLLTFLEGILTFISPCMLPMLPMYFSYLAGNGAVGKTLLKNTLGFVLGFSIIFVLLGAASGALGSFVVGHQKELNLISGIVLILFGLNFTGLLNIPLLNRTKKLNLDVQPIGFFSALLFGSIFAIGWTPCIGTFLGSALILAANSATALNGILLLGVYSLGLGIPFMLSALLVSELQKAFTFIKAHYKLINILSGLFLIILGAYYIWRYIK